MNPTLNLAYFDQYQDFQPYQLGPIYDGLAANYDVLINQSDYDIAFYGPFGNTKPDPAKINIYYTGESIPVKPSNWDLSFGYDHLDDQNYMRLPIYYSYFKERLSTDIERLPCNPNKEYFACFLYSNNGERTVLKDGCLERTMMFFDLSDYKFVASGGRFLNNLGYKIPKSEAATEEFYNECKFVITYENGSYPGYLTEKLFSAYLANSVPIYYGHEQNLLDINKDAIIFAPDFDNREALIEYIKQLDNDDKQYCDIYNQPLITNPEMSYESIINKVRDKLQTVLKKQLS